jgi:hypothetical protein
MKNAYMQCSCGARWVIALPMPSDKFVKFLRDISKAGHGQHLVSQISAVKQRSVKEKRKP